jgi:hypothetical protein
MTEGNVILKVGALNIGLRRGSNTTWCMKLVMNYAVKYVHMHCINNEA